MPFPGTNVGLPDSFTHLEVHSHFTLLGATASVEQLVERAAADGLSHLALTDSNVLYGAVSFDKACRATGLQPILGMAVSTAFDQDDLLISAASSLGDGRLLLLATGPAGYRSLCRLSSHLQGQPGRNTFGVSGVGWDDLRANAEGLICLSGGRRGDLYQLLKAGDLAAASRYVARLGGIFDESAYLALELGQAGDAEIAREILTLGRRFGLPPVALQPVYYLEQGSGSKLRLLQAIERNCSLEEISEDSGGYHWFTPGEMAARFSDFPEALEHIGHITGRCQAALPDGRPIWPALRLPQGQTPEDALVVAAESGLLARYGPRVPIPVRERLEVELTAINRSGYTPLFIIVADITRFARQQEIPVSTRGSVANSLVAYCTGITTVDPIANDLLFERFLNPARANPPDIDLDFCSRRRDEVLAYVRHTYGPDRVALVATINTLRPKSAVRLTAKAFGLTEPEISQLAKQLPRGWHPDPRRRDSRTVSDLAAELKDPRHQEILLAASSLVGQPHHLGIHPGGLVITPGPLTDHVPVQYAPKGFLITQFDYRDIEALGLPKLDLLGIRALTVLADTVDLVRRFHNPDFRLAQIPLDDPETARLLEEGDTIGVFQCESAGARRTLRQLRARNLFDLAVANAFFKPGPATGGMAQTFIRRYRGEEEVQYLHPTLVPILSATQGVLIFQEQVLRLATEIAGLSWEQADHLRRGMSKFQAEEMAAMQADFVAGCCRPAPGGPGFLPEQAETLWGQVLAFAGYGFNRGHATAYADVSYRCAYLKAHWPEAFLCARLAGWGGFHHPAVYMAEATRLGFAIRPPHINHSWQHFTLSYEAAPGTGRSKYQIPLSPILWLGLAQVRQLRRQTVKAIIGSRKEAPFSDLADLVGRIPLQKKELRHLIQCGGLDGLGSNRSALLAQADLATRAGATQQMTFDFAQVDPPAGSSAESPADRLRWETHILGQPITVHPLDLVEKAPVNTLSIKQMLSEGFPQNKPCSILGVRLPGWTGGPGFFRGDQETYLTVRGDEGLTTPEPGLPLLVHGRWRSDQWGVSWFQAGSISPIQ